VNWRPAQMERAQAASLRVVSFEERERRLTDMYLDGLLDRAAYSTRRERLVLELAQAKQERDRLTNSNLSVEARTKDFFDFVRQLGVDDPYADLIKFRETIKSASSNRALVGKKLCVTLQFPLGEIASELSVLRCDPPSGASRTFSDYPAVLGFEVRQV
jgi:hypothetical protein